MSAWTFQPDSCDQMLSRQSNSEEDMPNCGISARASARGSALLRSSVLVTRDAGGVGQRPGLAAVGLGTAVVGGAGGALLALGELVLAQALRRRGGAQRGGGAVELGSGCEKTPVETASPVAATAIPERIATVRRRRRRRACRACTGALRCLAACLSDKV